LPGVVDDFGAYWEGDIRLEALLPRPSRQVYPVCTAGKRAAPPEDCRGAWRYLERLDQHRLYPPLEAMGVVAEALTMLVEADPQTAGRAALGDLEAFCAAVDCLEAYEQFQPDHCDRYVVKRQLQSLVWSAKETV
jgi:hypothetical protein